MGMFIMSEHTKELGELEYEQLSKHVALLRTKDKTGSLGIGEQFSLQMRPDYSRRIVACVNACAGYSTEELENHPSPLIIKLLNERDTAIQQRDQLLEALKDCIESLTYAAYNIDGSKIDDLPNGIVESTSSSITALISARRALFLIAEIEATK